jgi:ribonuclease-3
MLTALTELEAQLGVAFRNRAVLLTALTHRSWCNENADDAHNERLEFLGDAALELIVSEWLYERYPEHAEGQLTLLRAALVCGETLARLAEQIGIPSALRLSRGEELSGARTRVPILANAFEAVIGAVLLDQGLTTTRSCVRALFTPELEHLDHAATRDPKSLLQEWVQAREHAQPRYELVAMQGPQHAPTFAVAVWVNGRELARGAGRNKHRAEIDAAQNALLVLQTECRE